MRVSACLLLIAALTSCERASDAPPRYPLGVQLGAARVDETPAGWTIDLLVELGQPPGGNGFVPLRVALTPTVVYERVLTQTGQTVPTVQPKQVQGAQAMVVLLDAQFTDATGRMYSRARVPVQLTRGRGFEAGEYTISVSRAIDGVALGGAQPLVLQGQNPIIDRRPIIFR